jgi:hypothetical protein
MAWFYAAEWPTFAPPLTGGMSPEDIGRQIVRIFRHDVKEKEGVERVSPAR